MRITLRQPKKVTVGQAHYKAKNSDREVEMARALHEGGMGYAKIAALMEVSKATVAGWIKGRRRSGIQAPWRM
jgi:transposase